MNVNVISLDILKVNSCMTKARYPLLLTKDRTNKILPVFDRTRNRLSRQSIEELKIAGPSTGKSGGGGVFGLGKGVESSPSRAGHQRTLNGGEHRGMHRTERDGSSQQV